MDEQSTRPLLLIGGDLHNLGDLALTMQNLLLAREGGRKAYVRRWAPLPATIEAQVTAAGGAMLDWRSPLSMLNFARRCDMVIGGGQLVRSNVSLKALSLLLVAASAVRLGGGRITTRGLGVGRIPKRLPRLLWRGVFALCHRINVRDAASADNAARLVSTTRVMLTADMAFLPSPLHDRFHLETSKRESLVIAPCRDPSEGRSLDGAGFAAVLSAAKAVMPDAKIVFACHDPRPQMDEMAAEDIAKAYSIDGDRTNSYELDVLLATYAEASLVITNRLHSVIFALLAERPILVVDDGTHKIAAVAEQFSLPTVDALQQYSAFDAGALVSRAMGPDWAAWRARKQVLSEAACANLAI